MIKFSLAYLLMFLWPGVEVLAQQDDTILTKEQTAALIPNISNHEGLIRKTYGPDNKLVYEEYFGIPHLIYKKYYYPNGQLSKHGFYYVSHTAYHAIGIWQYYNTKGDLYKEADLYTRTRKLYGMNGEPCDELFLSARKKADDYIIARFGFPFFEEHFRYDVLSSYWSTETNDNTYATWFDTPDPADSLYFHFYYDMVVGGEKVRSYFLRVVQGKVKEGMYDSLPDCAHDPEKCNITMTLERAKEIAANKNFTYTHYSLDYTDHAWQWVFHTTDYKDTCNQEIRGRNLSVNCLTGETAESKWGLEQPHNKCPYPYKHPNRHAVPLKAGEKKVEFCGQLEINVPVNWQHIEEAHENNTDRKYFTSGQNDTLFFDSFFLEQAVKIERAEYELYELERPVKNYYERVCIEYINPNTEERKKMRECDSLRELENRNHELYLLREKQIVDSIKQVKTQKRFREEKRERERKALQDGLEETFEGCVSGKRTVTCQVKAFDNDTYSIEVTFRDHLYDYPNYFVRTNKLDLETIKAMAAIMKTIRFSWE